MTTITQDLFDILHTIRRPGDYCTSGKADIFAPGLEVSGIGSISLPLLPEQARHLIAIAERAPYGRGEDTLIDTEVRRTWQIGAERIQITGRHWKQDLANIVARCASGLGITSPVSAELYKLLIYDTGSFFVSHRDTEKSPGMFASLVIVLPSVFTGGDLLIRHQDREMRLDLACDDPAEVAFAAFYADCLHEVRPVDSGCRLTLIYNLTRCGSGRLPEPPAYDEETQHVTELLQRWATASSESDEPEKLIYPLEHVYTPAEFGFATLKNADAAAAMLLKVAARRADCELHLALVAIKESGSAEESCSHPRGRYRRGADDDDSDEEFEVVEVFERTLSLSDWHLPDASRPVLSTLPFIEDELCPPDAFDGMAPDEQSFFEATGNEGASFERSYRRAALVLWPREHKLDILAAAGNAVSLPWLAEMSREWLASGAEQGSPAWLEAQRLAYSVIAYWPTDGQPSTEGRAGEFLTSLARLGDTRNIELVLTTVCAQGNYHHSDNEGIGAALCLLSTERAGELLERIVTTNAALHTAACAGLVACVAAASSSDEREARVRPAAAALLGALPVDPATVPKSSVDLARAAKFYIRYPSPALPPQLAIDVLSALQCINARDLGERAVDHFLTWPARYPLDTALVPVALQLSQSGPPAWPPARRLCATCLEHLERRIGEALEPPADYARAHELPCACEACTELSHFLADPLRGQWVFRAREALRCHVEYTIRDAHCDLDTATERRGSPHALVCTKNQISYQERVAQRERDLEMRAWLIGPV